MVEVEKQVLVLSPDSGPLHLRGWVELLEYLVGSNVLRKSWMLQGAHQ